MPYDASAMLLWGAFGYLTALVPPNLGHEVGLRLATMRVVATGILVATTLLFLPIETATVGDGWPDALNPAMARAVLFGTSPGWAWAARCLAAVALALAASLPERKRLPGTALEQKPT